jgi:small subunit ribosomal protein S21
MEVSSLSVSLRAGESQEELLKRWRKAVARAGTLKALRKKRWFVSKSEKRRLAKARAIRKARRKKNRRPNGGGRSRR